MDSQEPTDLAPDAPKPRTSAVIGLFIAAAALMSYLFAYAFTNALVKAEFYAPWQPGQDPRPRRFIIGFIAILSLFTLGAGLLRVISRRHDTVTDTIDSDDQG